MKLPKTCPICLEEFTGRKNKIYCSLTCKSIFNNNKASQLHSELIDEKVMLKNYRILKKFYESSQSLKKIEVVEFLREGFDFKCPSRKVKSPINGYELFIVHKYAYRVIFQNGNQYIVISKKDEINSL